MRLFVASELCQTSITQLQSTLLVDFVLSFYGISCYYIFRVTDKVFGPATTTRHVYDVAAQHVVSGAMEGINGNAFSVSYTCVY